MTMQAQVCSGTAHRVDVFDGTLEVGQVVTIHDDPRSWVVEWVGRWMPVAKEVK